MNNLLRFGTILLSCLLFSGELYCQIFRVDKTYYATDTSSIFGIRIKDKGSFGNSEYCHLIQKGELKLLSPSDIVEYGLEDGTRYFSEQIQINNKPRQVFLEELVSGELSLYYYRAKGIKAYYIQKGADSTIVKLIKKAKEPGSIAFNDYLRSITTDCELREKKADNIDFTRAALTKYTRGYNLCEKVSLLGKRYGISLGIGAITLSPGIKANSETLQRISYSPNLMYSAAIFIEYPFGYRNFSMIGELGISKFIISDYSNIGVYEYELLVDGIRFELPLLIRYTFINGSFNSFAEAGGIAVYNSLNNNDLFEGSPDGDIININRINTDGLLTPIQFGPLIGVGAEFPDFNGFTLFVEAKYGISLSSGYMTLNSSFLQFSTGIIF